MAPATLTILTYLIISRTWPLRLPKPPQRPDHPEHPDHQKGHTKLVTPKRSHKWYVKYRTRMMHFCQLCIRRWPAMGEGASTPGKWGVDWRGVSTHPAPSTPVLSLWNFSQNHIRRWNHKSSAQNPRLLTGYKPNPPTPIRATWSSSFRTSKRRFARMTEKIPLVIIMVVMMIIIVMPEKRCVFTYDVFLNTPTQTKKGKQLPKESGILWNKLTKRGGHYCCCDTATCMNQWVEWKSKN